MSAIRVLRKVKVDGGWKRMPVAKNGDVLDWGRVQVGSKNVAVTSGTFYLEYRDPKKVRRAVGCTIREAKAALLSQASVLALRSRGVVTDDAPEIHSRRRLTGKTLTEAINEFCAELPLGLRAKSWTKYKFDLKQFQVWAKSRQITHLSQLGRTDMRAYMNHLVTNDGLALKTAVNKTVAVLKRLRDSGAKIEMAKGDWPKITEEQPEIYTASQLRAIFTSMRSHELVVYRTFLLSGFRDQEVGFLAITDFDPENATLKVTRKPKYKFDPKNYKERTVTIPPELVDVLQEHISRLPQGSYFIFGTSQHNVGRGRNGGQRDKHMLAKLKQIALRGGHNCGRCEGMHKKKPATCTTAPICEQWNLHKFRHTYATTLLHDGVDIYTVKELLGHERIESTLKYLRMVKGSDLKRKINSSSLLQMCA